MVIYLVGFTWPFLWNNIAVNLMCQDQYNPDDGSSSFDTES